ncbi:oxidoreductase [Cytophagales bacterium WSM2-2]|nr:oxidoreductase [Cytophagales bacterium WSM2-2]
MKNQRVLISGAGIAGLTLAYWLRKSGFTPTVVEQYPKLREGGYLIDFFGVGIEVAERMGIISDLEKHHIPIHEMTFVDVSGKRVGGLNMAKIRKLLKNRSYNFLRSDLAKVIYSRVEKDVEVIFGSSIISIDQKESHLNVSFNNIAPRSFDLVIGADGLHSNVRKLLFGDESSFVKYLGYYTASYSFRNYHIKKDEFLSFTVPGKQVAIYSVKEHQLAFFLFSRAQRLEKINSYSQDKKWVLRSQFNDLGWKCEDILYRMNMVEDFYFDEVSQVILPKWSQGRVSLVGDACGCPSLLSGQGSTLAMTGAYVLANELARAKGDYQKAFAEYEKMMRPFIESKQERARQFAKSFLPQNYLGVWLRNTFCNLMFLPIISKWFVNNFMTDKFSLPDVDQHHVRHDPVRQRDNMHPEHSPTQRNKVQAR